MKVGLLENFSRARAKEEKERCSGSYCQAVGFTNSLLRTSFSRFFYLDYEDILLLLATLDSIHHLVASKSVSLSLSPSFSTLRARVFGDEEDEEDVIHVILPAAQ